MKFDELGREIHEGKPVALPVGYKQPPTLEEDMRRMIRQEMSLAAMKDGFETFEEADDFEIEGEDLSSPWEYTEDQEEEDRQKAERYIEMRKKRAALIKEARNAETDRRRNPEERTSANPGTPGGRVPEGEIPRTQREDREIGGQENQVKQ